MIATYTFTRFMFVCIWKRMRQMDDNLIVRIATIQAIFLCLLFQAATWLQLQRVQTMPVSSYDSLLNNVKAKAIELIFCTTGVHVYNTILNLTNLTSLQSFDWLKEV